MGGGRTEKNAFELFGRSNPFRLLGEKWYRAFPKKNEFHTNRTGGDKAARNLFRELTGKKVEPGQQTKFRDGSGRELRYRPREGDKPPQLEISKQGKHAYREKIKFPEQKAQSSSSGSGGDEGSYCSMFDDCSDLEGLEV